MHVAMQIALEATELRYARCFFTGDWRKGLEGPHDLGRVHDRWRSGRVQAREIGPARLCEAVRAVVCGTAIVAREQLLPPGDEPRVVFERRRRANAAAGAATGDPSRALRVARAIRPCTRPS